MVPDYLKIIKYFLEGLLPYDFFYFVFFTPLVGTAFAARRALLDIKFC